MNVFERLRRALAAMEERVRESSVAGAGFEAFLMKQRTERIAREPVRFERPPDSIACMVLERSGRRYAVPIESLGGVSTLGPIAQVPGTPEPYLGVTDRRGRVVAVVDLPRLFSTEVPKGPPPRWLIMVAHPDAVAGVAADELHDIIDVDPRPLARAMPTFPSLAQRHTIGVMENRTVVVNLGALLGDRALRVEDRG